jgi:hypothetical protein
MNELSEAKKNLMASAQIFKGLGSQPDAIDLGCCLAELMGRQEYLERLYKALPSVNGFGDFAQVMKKGQLQNTFSIATYTAWLKRHVSETAKVKNRLEGVADGDNDNLIGLAETFIVSGALIGSVIGLFKIIKEAK